MARLVRSARAAQSSALSATWRAADPYQRWPLPVALPASERASSAPPPAGPPAQRAQRRTVTRAPSHRRSRQARYPRSGPRPLREQEQEQRVAAASWRSCPWRTSLLDPSAQHTPQVPGRVAGRFGRVRRHLGCIGVWDCSVCRPQVVPSWSLRGPQVVLPGWPRWHTAPGRPTFGPMPLPSPAHGPLDPPPETPAARASRLAREAEMIAEARAQLDAGQGRTGRDLDAWLDAWEGDGDLPPRRPAQ